jgi:hypothetical protein
MLVGVIEPLSGAIVAVPDPLFVIAPVIVALVSKSS